MKQVKLQFPGVEEVWNFLAATRKVHVEVDDATAEGWFTEPELELACGQFGAQVQLHSTLETPPVIEQAGKADEGAQTIELYGKSGRAYAAKIYTKADYTPIPASPALVCLANSEYTNGNWQHRVNAIFATNDTEQERERFSQRDDVSHFIVVPASEWSGTDAADDLIRSYLHG